MSNWVKVLGNIKIYDIKKQGYQAIFNLKDKEELEEFLSNSNNWKHTYNKKEKELFFELQDYLKDYFNKLDTPYGSESNMEISLCFDDKTRKIGVIQAIWLNQESTIY